MCRISDFVLVLNYCDTFISLIYQQVVKYTTPVFVLKDLKLQKIYVVLLIKDHVSMCTGNYHRKPSCRTLTGKLVLFRNDITVRTGRGRSVCYSDLLTVSPDMRRSTCSHFYNGVESCLAHVLHVFEALLHIYSSLIAHSRSAAILEYDHRLFLPSFPVPHFKCQHSH